MEIDMTNGRRILRGAKDMLSFGMVDLGGDRNLWEKSK